MVKIYGTNEASTGAFLLDRGTIVHQLPDGHTFTFSGHNVIFGVTEILVGWEEDKPPHRLLEVQAEENSIIKPVPVANLKKLIKLFHIGFNINQQLARLLVEINRRLEHMLSSQSEKERQSQKCARNYAIIVEHIHEAFNRLRFPVLKELYEEFSNSLTYPFGQALRRVLTKAVIDLAGGAFDSLLREYPQDAVICRQGDSGDTLFILRSGMLGIYLGELEKPVATITTSGEVIGEMSLLLNEPRTATMRAETPVKLSAIARSDLQQVVEGKADFFIQLGVTLSKRIVQALSLLKHLIAAAPDPEEQVMSFHDPHRDAFRTLERRIKEMLHEHDFPIMKTLQEELRNIKS